MKINLKEKIIRNLICNLFQVINKHYILKKTKIIKAKKLLIKKSLFQLCNKKIKTLKVMTYSMTQTFICLLKEPGKESLTLKNQFLSKICPNFKELNFYNRKKYKIKSLTKKFDQNLWVFQNILNPQKLVKMIWFKRLN